MKIVLLNTITALLLTLGLNAQTVNIPDPNFKSYLVGNSLINTDLDSEIQLSEANSFTGEIDCVDLGISDLTGIEEFTSITALDCRSNNLNSINISQNIALTSLKCGNLFGGNNSMNNLDITQNEALVYLECNDLFLTTLDLHSNTALTEVYCYNNTLNALDVTQNTNLTALDCFNNNINTLDLSNNTLLEEAYIESNDLTVLNLKNISTTVLTDLSANTNPNLNCVDVDDLAAATSDWTNFDNGVSFSINCQVDLASSITVQGFEGNTTINSPGGTLQMEASILPTYVDDDTYTWSVNNGTGSATIDASGILTALTNGSVTVMATANDASGISGTMEIHISNQSSMGIYDIITSPKASIHPNPTNGKLHVDFGEKLSQVEMSVYNTIGQKILVDQFFNSSQIEFNINEKPGVYYLYLKTDGASTSKIKIIKL